MKSLGILEYRGITGGLEAADAMTKAADVNILATQKIGNALIYIVIEGTVSDIEAALAAGKRRIRELGEYYASSVLPRPDPEVYKVIEVISR